MKELKPCPFCGSKGEMRCDKKPDMNGYFVYSYVVDCSRFDCPASYMIGNDFDTEAEAIEAWNRRINDERRND